MENWAKMVSMILKTHYLLKAVWSYRLVKYHCCSWETNQISGSNKLVRNFYLEFHEPTQPDSLVRPRKTTVVLVIYIEYCAGFGETANVNANWKRWNRICESSFVLFKVTFACRFSMNALLRLT